jgi:hypothetical protein
MSRAKRAVGRRKKLLVPAIGISGAAVVAGVAMAAQLRTDNDQGASPVPTTSAVRTQQTPSAAPTTSAGQTQQTPSAAPTTKSTSAAQAAAEVVRACTAEMRSTEAMVGAVRVAATHWREHVQAQTDLTAGKNTTATTTAIWKRTRLAGPGDITRVSLATANLKKQAGCARLRGPAATSCSQRKAAMEVAITTGRAAAQDWSNHLSMMAAHASGNFGSIHAQQLWIDQWRAAPKNLDAFARAAAALSKAPACAPA